MDAKLKQYLDSGNYLPDFMEDFHDQKTLFKRLNEMVATRKDGYTDNINWIEAQVYTVDVFLWYMAAHGYTLQKSRKQVPFYDVNHDLSEYEKKQREIHSNLLKQVFEENQKEQKEKI